MSTPSLDTGLIPDGSTEAHASVVDFISRLIPANLVGAITGGTLLAALVVSLLLGIAPNMSAPCLTSSKALTTSSSAARPWRC